MYLASIDCGTSTTRVYIIDELGQVYGRASKAIGVRNTVIEGSNASLRKAIYECFLEACAAGSIDMNNLSMAIAAGMITSELGIAVVPHLHAPAKKEDLANHLYRLQDDTLLPVPIDVYLIPGLKNCHTSQSLDDESVLRIDFMRGEEVQGFGLLQSLQYRPPYVATILSSHTKFMSIDEQLNIAGSITTISGQMYSALKNETFIGKSIQPTEEQGAFQWWHPRIVDMACDSLQKGGFLRSLMMGRFMDVLLDTKWYERKLYIEALIAFEDMKALDLLSEIGCNRDSDMFLIGEAHRCKLYDYVLKERSGWTGLIHHITDQEQIDALNIKGSLAIVRAAGLIS